MLRVQLESTHGTPMCFPDCHPQGSWNFQPHLIEARIIRCSILPVAPLERAYANRFRQHVSCSRRTSMFPDHPARRLISSPEIHGRCCATTEQRTAEMPTADGGCQNAKRAIFQGPKILCGTQECNQKPALHGRCRGPQFIGLLASLSLWWRRVQTPLEGCMFKWQPGHWHMTLMEDCGRCGMLGSRNVQAHECCTLARHQSIEARSI
ncbi:hypothetical protein BD311DRAFT_744161 [Dichomitus squalens]|uniref:Uncharacterized protein n=1 Tax=Dichomitus squalens TaxID=114155 RepID=A0A4V2K271_9APHY|nr:hypothetical protein BD311DRAFT_744161 [Dichomitus squalens]